MNRKGSERKHFSLI